MTLFHRVGYVVLCFLGALPLQLVMLVGSLGGGLMAKLMAMRRQVCARNLELCFPDMPVKERERLLVENFKVIAKGVLGHCVILASSRNRIRRIVKVDGMQHLAAQRGRPTILLCPHFAGGNMLNVWATVDHEVAMLYSPQHSQFGDWILQRVRKRFGGTMFRRRQDMMRACRWVKSGRMLSYSPDMDMNTDGGVEFVPFFGVERTATTIAMSRIARITGAQILPAKVAIEKGGYYRITFYPVWENYPSDNDRKDAERMNHFLEGLIADSPEQYYWLHRRFKTRPEGDAGLY